MLKTNIKLIFLSSILFFQISSSAFSMLPIKENNTNIPVKKKVGIQSLREISNKNIKIENNDPLPTEVPIGSIIAFAGDKEPEGWLMCDGLQYSSKKYPKLYETIKTKYVPKEIRFNILDHNESNDDKLFCVPDLRGRVIVGVDGGSGRVTSNNKLGEIGGEEKHKLTIEELATHNHSVPVGIHNITGSTHARYGQSNTSINSENSGGDQPHNNMQPYLVSNYIIKAEQNEKVQQNSNINLISKLEKQLEELKISQQKSIFKASFNNKEPQWVPYRESSWKAFQFDSVDGNIEQDLLSAFIIPEDGVYSLRVHYCWRSAKDFAGSYTGIAINNCQEVKSFAHHHLFKTEEQVHNELNFTTHLKKGEKVMTSILGHPNVEYYSGNFQFYIEKIN